MWKLYATAAVVLFPLYLWIWVKGPRWLFIMSIITLPVVAPASAFLIGLPILAFFQDVGLIATPP